MTTPSTQSRVSRSTCLFISSFQSSQFISNPSTQYSPSCTPISKRKTCYARPSRFLRSRIVCAQQVTVKQHEIFMPALSSTMTEGRIVQWLKQPGDRVEVGDSIMVVESDKADMDVESFEAGYLAAIQVEEGDSADVGATVGIIVENKDDISKLGASAPAPAASKDPTASAPAPAAPTSEPPKPAPSSPSPAPPKPKLAEIFMPALSSTMTEGKVVEWTKSEGDRVEVGDMVMVVESDKADMDVESFDEGFIAHISVDAGESCAVGDPVAFMAKTEADIPLVKAWATSTSPGASTEKATTPEPSTPATTTATAQASAPAPTTSPAPASMPVVNKGRIIASPLAKATAKKEGIDLKYVKGTGPGDRIVEADVLKAKEAQPVKPYIPPAGKIVATPDAKKVAKKEKIDLATVKGTGNFGRITAEDVLRAAGKAPAEVAKAPAPKSSPEKPAATPEPAKTKAEIPAGAVAMNAMQKAVAQNMTAALTTPVFRLTYTIKTRALDELYAKLKPKGVTLSALLAKAVAIALSRHPIMNALYSEDTIVYRSEINVAMAVAMKDGGLITPTLINADKVDLYTLSRNWKDLVQRAMDKKLKPKEYSGGAFIVSNLGMFGVDQFDAILPPGVPGILAIGASKPVVGLQENGLVGVHKEMKVTLTGDHRIYYGADGAEFLKDLTNIIENETTELVM